MANYVYNSHSGESSGSQWKNYLQQREFASDITSAIKTQTKSYRDEIQKASKAASSAIDEASRQQAQAITDAANSVSGTLENLFSGLSMELNEFGTMLDWRLSEMVDQQRVSNLLQENVALLLRIPDIQKERQYHIEQGFKHYKNASLDPDFYRDALENLLEAEKREKTDYIVLHRIGMIYLYAPVMLDLPKAEEYFRRAAKYAAVESDPNALRLFNILAGDIRTGMSGQFTAPEAVKALAAESCFQAGIACYAQGHFTDALNLSNQAFSLHPALLEAGFMKARLLAASGDEVTAVSVLEGVIKAERFYAVKTAGDGDLALKQQVQELLLRLRDEAVAQAQERITKTKTMMLPYSEASSLINEIETLNQRNTYLDALAALDALSCKRQWSRASVQSIESLISFEIKCDEEARRQEQANILLSQAHEEYQRQQKRWGFPNYKEAYDLFCKASALGSIDGKKWAEFLSRRMNK